MASSSKQRRVDYTVSDDHLLSDLQSGLDNDMRMSLISAITAFLAFPGPSRISVVGSNPSHTPDTIQPLRIRNCNAADIYGVEFSSASCCVEPGDLRVLLIDIFERGIRLIVNFLKNKQLPSTRPEKFILWKLLRYVQDEDLEMKNTFKNVDELTETDLVTLLANHLFGRLSTNDDFIIDKTCHGKGRGSKKKCHCGNEDCNLTGSFGDTSIGNSKVWHGSVDIIIGNDLCVEPIAENPDGSPGGKSSVEVKKMKTPNVLKLGQIVAETIVFSFLQKKRHPENNHFLTPCIGVGGNEMVIMFYDAMHDILLESSPIPLMEPIKNGNSRFTLHAILVSWLIVNYKFLCSGLTEKMISQVPKANFFELAKMKMDIYEKNMQFQNVGRAASSENTSTEYISIMKSPLSTEIFCDLSAILCELKE